MTLQLVDPRANYEPPHFIEPPPYGYVHIGAAVETNLDNSTLLTPLDDADFVFVNHARWDHGVPWVMVQQLTKRTFRSFVLANLKANRTTAMPVLYKVV